MTKNFLLTNFTYMFIAEKPIENEIDDILNRKSFAHHLGNSLV